MVSTRQMSTTLSTSTSGPSPAVNNATPGNDCNNCSSGTFNTVENDENNMNNNSNSNPGTSGSQLQQLPQQPTSQPTSTIRFVNTRSTVLATASSSATIISPYGGAIQQILNRGSTIRSSGSSYSNNNSLIMMMFDENSRDNDLQHNPEQKIFLLDLPIEILDKIFSYVGYKKLGHMRVISKQMNQVCSSVLNSTFSKLQTQMLNRFQNVKAKMPRRESARRNHPLACECDIIETCYMRLSLLQMTFGKHIERKHCCFFPAGILDEVYNVLHYIRTTPKLERPYRVTDELFDLSTMAMEYFKEHIEPNLPEIAYFSKDFFDLPTTKSKQTYSLKTTSEISDSCTSMPSPPQSNMVLRKGIRKIKQGMKMYNNQLAVLRSDLRSCKKKSTEQGKQIAEQQRLLAEHQKQTLEYANRLDENDRKNEEMSRKFSTLLQELNKCKTELQYWRSKSPAVQVCNSCGHKIAPFVPPEDFQTLINQGVKPENLIDDVDDCCETNSSNNLLFESIDDITGDGPPQQEVSVEFVFPDENTTAKLLAFNSTKSIKRNHDGNSSCSGNPSTSSSNENSVVKIVENHTTTQGGFNESGGNSKNYSKNIPAINPSTFYPSSTLHINGETTDAIQPTTTTVDGNKKRRIQKGVKRKL